MHAILKLFILSKQIKIKNLNLIFFFSDGVKDILAENTILDKILWQNSFLDYPLNLEI